MQKILFLGRDHAQNRAISRTAPRSRLNGGEATVQICIFIIRGNCPVYECLCFPVYRRSTSETVHPVRRCVNVNSIRDILALVQIMRYVCLQTYLRSQ